MFSENPQKRKNSKVGLGMKYFLHYCIKEILHIVLRVFYVFPIRSNRIFLINSFPFYNDSLKYINEYIKKKDTGNEYQVIFTFSRRCRDHNCSFLSVRPLSLKYFYYLMTSSVVVGNGGGTSYIPFRKRQIMIETWHGYPYKKIGCDVFTSKWSRKELELAAKGTTYVTSTCLAFIDFLEHSMCYTREKFLESGTPRIDIFFGEHQEIKNKICSYYGISEDTRIILYAPTFRSDASGFLLGRRDFFQYPQLSIDHKIVLKAFKNALGGNWRFAVRLHPRLKNLDLGDEILNFTEYPDTQELLYTADALITDYSSLMWDFSFTFRPCFLYAPDVEQYERERGFYTPPSSWPFPLARNNDELERNILDFDEQLYVGNVRRHHADCGSYETGHACEKVMELIENHVKSISR